MKRAITIALAGLISSTHAVSSVALAADPTPTPHVIPGELQFLAGPGFAVAPSVVGIVSGDFNGDHLPDLAVASSDAKQVTILLGDGLGGFTQATTSGALANKPAAIAADDFNGDGNLDVAVTESSTDNIEVLLGRGDGSLGQPSSFRVGDSPVSIVSGNFDGQTGPDLAVGNKNDDTVSFLFNRAPQPLSFYPPSNVASRSPIILKTADFNGDGLADVLAVNQLTIQNAAFDVTLLFGNGIGGFTTQPPASIGVNLTGLTTADFNGDGLPDVIASNSPTNSAPSTSIVTMLLSNGDGTFSVLPQPQVNCAAVGTTGCGVSEIAAADFDGDGNQDAVISQSGNAGSLLFFLGTGDGALTPFGKAQKTQKGVSVMIVDDFNADGRPDIVVGSNATMQLFLNQTQAQTPVVTATPVQTGTANQTPSTPGEAGTSTPTPTPTALTGNGAPCSDGSECASHICAQNRCCDRACDGTLERCDLNPPGVCQANYTPKPTQTQVVYNIGRSGGCSAGGDRSSGSQWAMLVLPVALWLGRRRTAIQSVVHVPGRRS
ncbi:MAG TPA: VCBS repeat-containing protein [Candidatus Binatia bacterium]|nr:VCBS repeat-containing protein [Candidatus Binatia bacterium]